MRIDILTLFPSMFVGPFDTSMLKKAKDNLLVEIYVHDIREYTFDKHRVVDDYPYGGGPGMVMKAEPIYTAIGDIKKDLRTKVVLTTPQGRVYNQELAWELARTEQLIIIAGHYEGVDERVTELVDEEISIGDYVLTGGEIPAMVLVDSVVRLLPGVLGGEEAAEDDSFATGLLEGPQYTRPEVFEGMSVPEVLLSGHHANIARWRREQALRRTKERRPDLLEKAILSQQDIDFLKKLED